MLPAAYDTKYCFMNKLTLCPDTQWFLYGLTGASSSLALFSSICYTFQFFNAIIIYL